MQSFKIVTLCSSNRGRKDELTNAFLPDRKISPGFKLRNKSAPLSSEFRPVTYSELKENFPKIITINELAESNRKDSLVSPRLRNEIKSAVLLIESRSKNDFTKLFNDRLREEKSNDRYIYKVHNRNQLSKSARLSIENRIQRNTNRWKSASLDINQSIDSSSANANRVGKHKLLSVKKEIDKKYQHFPENTKDSSLIDKSVYKNEPALITSISNSITNFLTIDEIYGAKSEWGKLNSPNLHLIKKSTENQRDSEISKHEKEKPLSVRSKRECILRDYMSVYLNWRTTKSIQEHRDLLLGQTGNSRIRTAVPKSRLQIFHQIIDEQQTHLSIKRINKNKVNKMNEMKTKNREIISTKKSHYLKTSTPLKHETCSDVNSEQFIEDEKKLTSIIVDNEESTEDVADEYSEIDWLQCTDI